MTAPQTLTDSDGDELLLHHYSDDRVTVQVYAPHANATVGPFPIADLRAALDALDPQEDETPEPAPTAPTAEDFAHAKFAVHEDGRFGARCAPIHEHSWVTGGHSDAPFWLTDEEMVERGWTIVTPAPTTPEDALSHFVSLLHEPEADTIPAGVPFVEVFEDGEVLAHPSGDHANMAARRPGVRRLTFHPLPASEPEPEPEWVKAPAVWVRDGAGWSVAYPRLDGTWMCDGTNYTRADIAGMDPRPIWEPES